jgi:hypothetical protein
MQLQENDHPLYREVNAVLRTIVTRSRALPPWFKAWLRLGSQSTEEERLAVYQAVRAAGSVPAEAGFFLVAWMLTILTHKQAEKELGPSEAEIEFIRKRFGLDEEVPDAHDDLPAEYFEAMQQVHESWGRLYLETIHAHGESDLGHLFAEDRKRFEKQFEIGRRFFHGSESEDADEDDDWLDRLHGAVSSCVVAHGPMGHLRLNYRKQAGHWEVKVYPTAVELMGGAQDGEVVTPSFQLDLEQLRGMFESVAALVSNTLGGDCPEGPNVSIQGVFGGREVCMQLLACAAKNEKPGLKLDARRQYPQVDWPGC